MAALRGGDTHYTAIAGKPALRAALAELARRRTGVPTALEEVIVMAGAQNGLFAAALSIVEAGDEVLLVEPAYATYEATVAASGARTSRVPASAADGFRPDVARLAAAVTPRTRAILMANPNNPSGVVMTESELAAVAAVARRHDLWVVTDEVYASLVFEGEHRSIRALPGMAERTVAIGSLSKSHAMTGWRFGWVTGPRDLVAHMDRLALNMFYGLPGFIQEAALTALDAYDATSALMRERYRARVEAVAEGLAGAPGIAMLRPASGMFALLDVRGTGLTSTDFAWGLFRSTGVSLVDAAAFGPSTAGFVRLALAADDARLAEACRRISRHARELARA